MHDQLDRLQSLLLEESMLAREALTGAVAALADGDMARADAVIDGDDRIDLRFMQVERAIEAVLARQTPVAGDLRLVLAMLHINTHLERVGDYSVTIAKLTKLTRRLGGDDAIIRGFAEMARQADLMTATAMEAFVERDARKSETLVALDEAINAANRQVVYELLELGAARDDREWSLRMILVSRCLERIGDHAVDIGEQVAYLVTGEFREFTDASGEPVQLDDAHPD